MTYLPRYRGHLSAIWYAPSALLFLSITTSVTACDWRVEHAWIRDAPPTVTMRAGYAKFVNGGDKVIRIVKLKSPSFAAVQMHETSNRKGVMRMRSIDVLEIPPRASVVFEPEGKHLMLLDPQRSIVKGERITIQLTDQFGCSAAAIFDVGEEKNKRRNTKEK